MIAEGATLREIANHEGMPHVATVMRWLDGHDKFREHYAHAREKQADAFADDIIDLANQAATGYIDPLGARVAIDAKKWAAGKRKPKVYGDKVDLTSDGKALPTPILGIINPSQPDETQRLQSGE